MAKRRPSTAAIAHDAVLYFGIVRDSLQRMVKGTGSLDLNTLASIADMYEKEVYEQAMHNRAIKAHRAALATAAARLAKRKAATVAVSLPKVETVSVSVAPPPDYRGWITCGDCGIKRRERTFVCEVCFSPKIV